jgi:hypothetical protein
MTTAAPTIMSDQLVVTTPLAAAGAPRVRRRRLAVTYLSADEESGGRAGFWDDARHGCRCIRLAVASESGPSPPSLTPTNSPSSRNR